MAAPVFIKEFDQDIRKPIFVQHGGGLMFTGDAQADTITVHLYDGEAEYTMSGSVVLNCIRADGATVSVAGTVSGNIASATLAQACCAVPGPLTVVMKVTSDGVTSTILKAVYTVDEGQTGTTVDPGTIIPDVAALIAAIETAVATIPPEYDDLVATVDDQKTAIDNDRDQDYTWRGILPLVWEQGSITTSGESDSPNLIRTDRHVVTQGDLLLFTVPSGYEVRIYKDNGNGTYSTFGTYSAGACSAYFASSGMTIRFRMSLTAGTAITPIIGEKLIVKKWGAGLIDDGNRRALNGINEAVQSGAIQLIWEQGNISSTGETVSSKNIHTQYIQTGDKIGVIPHYDDAVYVLSILVYDMNQTYISTIDAEPDAMMQISINKLVRFKLSLVSEGDLLPTAGENLAVNFVHQYNNPVTPQMFGAVGDGVADDRSAFQKALNSGYSVYIPTSNNEVYRISGLLTVPNTAKRIFGDSARPGTSTWGAIIFDLSGSSDPVANLRNRGLFRLEYDAQAITFSDLTVKSIDNGSSRLGTFIDATRVLSDDETDCMPDKDITCINLGVSHFHRIINMKGRGFTALDCGFTDSNLLAEFDWLTDSEPDSNTAHPKKYQQRGIAFKNCRLHSIQTSFITFVSGHGYGFEMIGNVCDVGNGAIIIANDEAWNWNISGNVFQGISKSVDLMTFANGMKNCLIANNIMVTADDFRASGIIPKSCIKANGAYGCVISGNAMSGCSENAIIFSAIDSGTVTTLNGISIVGNAFDNIDDAPVHFAHDATNVALAGNSNTTGGSIYDADSGVTVGIV